jgi:hypothetical protein
MASYTVATEYEDAYGRGYACGVYLAAEHDPDEMLAHFVAANRHIGDFLEDYKCKVDVTGKSRRWHQGFTMGLQHYLYGEASKIAC